MPIPMLINEYRLYLPSAGAFLACSAGAFFVLETLQAFQAALRHNPDVVDAHNNIGLVYLEKVRTLGGEVLYESGADDPRGELAIIEDPFGAPIGLMRWGWRR